MAKIIGNTTVTPYPRPDWKQDDENRVDYIKNKPTILSAEDVIRLIEENGSGGGGNIPTKTSQLINDSGFVADSNYVHTDNNFTNEDKSLISANALSALTAINIASGANQAKSFNNYGEMIEFLNQNPNWGSINRVTLEYQVGQNIMIGTINVPDLWIASKDNIPPVNYTYTTDEAFVNDLNNALANGEFLRVGFVTLGVLETQKVDLTEYSTTDQMNAAIQTAIGDVLGGAS